MEKNEDQQIEELVEEIYINEKTGQVLIPNELYKILEMQGRPDDIFIQCVQKKIDQIHKQQ